ncbi:unnamed protein product [Moneuplotes crassus]|uniref:Uncharacterized protein n=1 Tax=Euplotes crassus TaxID=5936 RepID=A0AAD1Y8Y7_EUPCR|nr:unnamed protein product [Moneuplotes crassus]
MLYGQSFEPLVVQKNRKTDGLIGFSGLCAILKNLICIPTIREVRVCNHTLNGGYKCQYSPLRL